MAEHDFESSEETGGIAGAPGDWRIGKGKPPVECQFPKGRSGNPAGRPRRSGAPGDRLRGADEPTRQTILDEAYRTVEVREGDSILNLSMNQAVIPDQGGATQSLEPDLEIIARRSTSTPLQSPLPRRALRK